MKSVNKCHHCGATSYKPVIKRDEQGAMNRSGLYRCTGCVLEFKTIDEWRHPGISQTASDDMNVFQKLAPS